MATKVKSIFLDTVKELPKELPKEKPLIKAKEKKVNGRWRISK
jgi:hypothetical protein